MNVGMSESLSPNDGQIAYRVPQISTVVANFQSVEGLSALYLVSALIFLVCLGFPQNPYFLVPRLISGFMALLLIPGAFLCAFFPKPTRDFGLAIVLGLLLVLLETQLLFTLALMLGITIPLAYWIVALNTIVVLIGLMYHRTWSESDAIRQIISFASYREILWIFSVAIIIRIALQLFAIGAIAPDASLYSDYARAMLDGQFHSNVTNDLAIQDLWNGVQHIRHQGTVFLFAISWLLFPPTTSGPTLILVIVGTLLIMPVYQLTKRVFGNSVAKKVTLAFALHPLFVFHSAIGYGPEIISLLFLVYAGYILANGFSKGSTVAFLFSGILLGFVDAIWYPNFYIGCLVLPGILFGCNVLNKKQFAAFEFLLTFVLISRLVLNDFLLFIACWVTIALFLGTTIIKWTDLGIKQLLPFFSGLLFAMLFWSWPLQIGIESESTQASQLGTVILAPITPEMLGRFLFFLVFHLSPVLVLYVLYTIYRQKSLRFTSSFAFAGLFSALGTLKVFGLMPESLQLVYIFSDSRFFLAVSLTGLIILGAFLSEIKEGLPLQRGRAMHRISRMSRERKSAAVLSILLIGFIPAYLVIPTGLELVRIEKRYGWSGLSTNTGLIGSEMSLYLVDRAREFSWITGRKSIVFNLSMSSLPDHSAYSETSFLAKNFSADYLLMDFYTYARWKTLEFLYADPIPIGSAVLFDVSGLALSSGNYVTSLSSLFLVGATEPNELERISRIYEFSNASCAITSNVNMLDSGWNASDSGYIVNSSGNPRLVIGLEQSYTNTWRPAGFDLDLHVAVGILVIKIQETSAVVTRISFWDEHGKLLRYAFELDDGLFYCSFGDVTIGDIRIAIEGNPGDSITIESAAVWTAD
jgi:hypothetical protein